MTIISSHRNEQTPKYPIYCLHWTRMFRLLNGKRSTFVHVSGAWITSGEIDYYLWLWWHGNGFFIDRFKSHLVDGSMNSSEIRFHCVLAKTSEWTEAPIKNQTNRINIFEYCSNKNIFIILDNIYFRPFVLSVKICKRINQHDENKIFHRAGKSKFRSSFITRTSHSDIWRAHTSLSCCILYRDRCILNRYCDSK